MLLTDRQGRTALDMGVVHLPPVDYRYGWDIAREQDQQQLLFGLLAIGTETSFAAPNCSPWGNQTRGLPDVQERRAREEPSLTFLAMCCYLQMLMGRRYIVENSGYSDIFEHSALVALRKLQYHMSTLDQCACNGKLEDQFIRKRSHFQSSHPAPALQILCPGGHKHLQLRGGGRAASAAQYPAEECRRILESCLHCVSTEGGRQLPAFQFFIRTAELARQLVRNAWGVSCGRRNRLRRQTQRELTADDCHGGRVRSHV